jgi:hypothetical protein
MRLWQAMAAATTTLKKSTPKSTANVSAPKPQHATAATGDHIEEPAPISTEELSA